MINKAIVRNILIAAGTFLLLLSVFAVSVVVFNLFAALLIVIAMIIAVWVLSKKLPMDLRKKITENIFIYITGGAALVMILFVIYILIDIFLIARPQLTWDFITKPPTEGLTSGGIFPAIIGTALLVIIMSVVGVPFGTITAIYLTEYAKENSKIAKFIRFAINTLAGVPAIVFGLFGLGFFIGTIGH